MAAVFEEVAVLGLRCDRQSRGQAPLAVLFLLLFCAVSAHAQTAHVAGVESVALSGSSGLSTQHHVAADSAGDLYIADTGNNRVLLETLSGGSYVQSVLATGLNQPLAVAVDSLGDVYIADSGNSRVVKETASGGSYTASIVGSGFQRPSAVAVDAGGNLYIADSTANTVVLETLYNGGYVQSPLATGLNSPLGVAVDGSGNVYIADTNNNRIVKETVSGGSYTASTLGSGLVTPASVTVDSAGNVYIADGGNNRLVLEAPSSGGSFTQKVLGSGLMQPYGVSADASGNIYVDNNSSTQPVYEIATVAGNFGNVAVGSNGFKVLSVVFAFDTAGQLGTLPFQVSTQGTTVSDFTSTGQGTCQPSTSYAAGSTCTAIVGFQPTESGARYGGVLLQGSAGTPIATGYVWGTGIGPQTTFLPSTQTVIASGLNAPRGLATDAAGNIYVTDTDNMRLLKLTPSGGTYTQSVVATSALYWPLAAVVGGTGNIYLADTWHSRILNETWTGNSYTESTVVSTGLDYPSGVALDAGGDVYIADAGSNRILKEVLTGTGTYTQAVLPFTGLSNPLSVALDGSGNIYVADTNHNRVVKGSFTNGTFVQSTVSTSSLNHIKLSVDAWGNLYIADEYNNRVLKETPANGSYVETTIGTGLSQPNDVVADGFGNVFIADTGNNRILKVDLVDPPALSFPSTYAGDRSAAQTVTLLNSGNAPLILPLPTTGSNPSIASNFSLNSSAANACPLLTASSWTNGTLLPGASCTLPVSFVPTTPGFVVGSLSLNDTNLNGSVVQTIALSGTALPPDVTATALTTSTNPVTSFSATTFSVTVKDTLNTGSTPSGNVTLSDTWNGTTVALNGGLPITLAGGTGSLSVVLNGVGLHTVTASYGGTNDFAPSFASTTVTVNPAVPTLIFSPIGSQTYGSASFTVLASSASSGAITYGVASGPAIVSGNVVTLTGAGTVVLNASQAVSGSYTAATASTSFLVGKASSSIALSLSCQSLTYGAPVALIVAAPGNATGTVTFTDGASPVGTASIAGGFASFSIPAPSAGAHVLSASWPGDSNYQGSNSATVNCNVSRAPVNITMTTSLNPSSYGDTVMISFSFVGSSAIPGGSATLSIEGAQPIATLTLDALGHATYVTAALAAGQHTYTITYGGDSNYY